MKEAVFVVLDQFADWEGGLLAALLNQDEGWQVKYASNQNQIHSIGGMNLRPDYKLNEIPEIADLLILIGGNSWDISDDSLYHRLESRLAGARPVAAICGAVDYLAKEGLLNTKRHTGNSLELWKGFSKYDNPEQYQLTQSVTDGNLVTANGTATLSFTESVLEMIRFSGNPQKLVDLYRMGFYQYSQKYGNPFG